MASATLSMANSVFRFAIVGSGPAGFYTAHQLIKKIPNALVDIFEKLPVPFGLVRYGVAPDHPEVKNVINQFTKLAKSGQCRFIGNVEVGQNVSVPQLKKSYSGLVLAYGAKDDRILNIVGENSKGVYSAKQFVGWYNGLPEYANFIPDLSGETAVIIGQGNVGLDVARILLSSYSLLKSTDICSHALDHLKHSNIKHVTMVGRGGPLHVAFNIKELRNMLRLPDCQAFVNYKGVENCRSLLSDLPRPRRRLTELLLKTAEDFDVGLRKTYSKTWELKFMSNPTKVLTNSDTGTVRGVRLEACQLDSQGVPHGTGQYEDIECSLLLRSIGYRSTGIDNSIPFDNNRGIIPNNNGRVIDHNNEVVKGVYCSGWVRRGAAGAVVVTMNDAFQTADNIVQDIDQGAIFPVKTNVDILKYIDRPVLFSDWEKIDQEEKIRGQRACKPREKIVSIQEMMEIIQ